MMRINRANRLYATLLTGALLVAGQAQAQAQPATSSAPASGGVGIHNDVAPVTVTGKRMPGTDAPKSATCEYLVQRDPFLRAQLQAAGGNPLMGPRIFLPTRLPRNPDYSAAPQGPIDISNIKAGKRGLWDTTDPAQTAQAGFDQVEVDDALASGGIESSNAALLNNTDDLAIAINACRVGFQPGGAQSSQSVPGFGRSSADGRFTRGRAQIARRDTTLATGFALFDQGYYAEALESFRKAHQKLTDVEGGDEAALMIGKIYLQGLGEKSDPKEAVKWLERAAGTAFNPANQMPIFDPKEPARNTATGEAAVILANVNLAGFGGVPKDSREAVKWLKRASYVGHVPAAKTLGDLYYSGREVPVDVKAAVGFYKQAAILDYAPAQYALGEIYAEGDEGVAANRKTALAWYARAAGHGHSGALYALAAAYDTGKGVQADPQKALVYYKASALAGNADAQAALGSFFYEGQGVPRDHAIARKWFETAALAGQPDAMFNMGAMTIRGEGGEKSLAKGWVWLKAAQAQGNLKAPVALAAVERRMTPDERKTAQELFSPRKS